MEQQPEMELIRAASEELSLQFKTLINTDQVDNINELQHLILGRLQDSNAILSHFNDYSQQCFAEVSGDLSHNTRLLRSMKLDLDYIFQKLSTVSLRIRVPDDSVCTLYKRLDEFNTILGLVLDLIHNKGMLN
ncbi:hypothetical protein GIB67_022246 [Kingdonia uniflora]|uniref:KxDL domain-containing protein n=1 Tax=Kingdonia uniflora TaxID=39325 RepID=A0A7J7M784_9MAGN|nr:hypothetical protein GIB67_022246 [Kingdonia uniflora]